MTIQEWFDKRKEAQIERRTREAKMEAESVPGLWVKCVHCEAQLTKKELEDRAEKIKNSKDDKEQNNKQNS